jgi:transposase
LIPGIQMRWPTRSAGANDSAAASGWAGPTSSCGCAWWTLWRALKPSLQNLANDEPRYQGLSTLRVDEHVWHHVSPSNAARRGSPGMVDLTRVETGVVHARLLNLVPGHSGGAYATWLNKAATTSAGTSRGWVDWPQSATVVRRHKQLACAL